MNKSEVITEIEKIKKLLPKHETFEKGGRIYHRFIVQKVELPAEIGKKFLNIMYDEKSVPYVVLNILEGLSKEEKEKRKMARLEAFKQRSKERHRIVSGMKQLESDIRISAKSMNFQVCEELKAKLELLKAEYEDKFARKKLK